MTISLLVAHSRNRVIGRDNALPWRLPSDLKRFRELTTGATVVMGRKTYESLPPSVRPLPDRRNLVLSTQTGYAAAGAEVCADLDSALAACERRCFVIGGAGTYAQALARATRIYATEIEQDIDGDARFPDLDTSQWRCTWQSARHEESSLTFTYRIYDRTR